jgi:recombination protein RecA
MVRKKTTKGAPLFDSSAGGNEAEVNEAKLKAIEATLADITKRFGDGTVIRLGDAKHMQVDTIPSGSLGVDIALGVGGIPRGRITEIYGPESSGKTTLCLHVIAEAQKRGGLCAFIDMENALDPLYAERIGVNLETLFVSQPDTGEQALEITESLVRSGALDVVVVDSVAALVPRAEIEGEMGDSHVGLQARLMSQALRKLAGAVKQSNVSLLFTNQLREKVGVMFGCFPAESQVLLADGRTQAIGDIVDNQLDLEVLSWNEATDALEPKPIKTWFKNGVPVEQFDEATVPTLRQDFVTIVARSLDGEITTELTCTPNHQIATPYGFMMAQDLDLEDVILAQTPVAETALAMADASMGLTNGYAFAPEVVLSSSIAQISEFEVIDIFETTRIGKEAIRYNLEVGDNHTYIVNDVIVHNSPETTPGGRALKFYASVRIDIRRTESIKSGEDVVGNRTKIKIKKNKVAPPFKECEFDIMFMEGGISKTGEIIDLGVNLGIVEKRGAFFRYNEGLLGQGRENARQFLLENPSVSLEIEDALRQHYNLPSIVGGGD